MKTTKKTLVQTAILFIVLVGLALFFDSFPFAKTIFSALIFFTPVIYTVVQDSAPKAPTRFRHSLDYKVYLWFFSPIFLVFLIIIFFDLWEFVA